MIPEYPVALAISPLLWAVSDGTGRIYIVRIDPEEAKWTGNIEACFELAGEPGGELLPFRMHAVNALPTGQTIALLSVTVKIAAQEPSPLSGAGGLSAAARLKIPSTTVFDLLAVDISLASIEADGDVNIDSPVVTKQLEPLWRFRTHDLPNYVAFDPLAKRYIIGAPTALYNVLQETAPHLQPDTRPVSAPSAAPEAAAPSAPAGHPNPRPPPYSWTQDGESLTVVFAVPSDTPTSSIRTTFSRQFLTLLVGNAIAALSPSSTPGDLPHVAHKKLWDVIDPHTSVWTFDREAEGRDSTYGLLSLHLEKGNQGTRWLDLFASSPPAEDGVPSFGEADRWLEGVPETMDPSELANISESMEQYTQGVAGGVGAPNEGAGHGVPTSLMGEEIDVEVDGDSGRPLVLTWIEDADTQTPRLVRPHPTIPYSLLSVPLPLATSTTIPPLADSTIVIKHDVDGLLFLPPPVATGHYAWAHTSTFPALAFVLATKRDAYFVHHVADKAVFAFDSPSQFALASAASGTRSGAGNLFVYFNTGGVKDTAGRQLVLRVGGPNSGSLMGVGGVAGPAGRTVLLALCEKELVVFRLV